MIPRRGDGPGWEHGIDGDLYHKDWQHTLDGDYRHKDVGYTLDGDLVMKTPENAKYVI